jgi:hypothetical protein
VDGIVFVVDSQSAMFDACKESCQNLEENLRELGLNLHDIPMVFQWNKRDLKNVVPVEELEAAFNTRGLPSFQSVASDGTGVFETLRGITKLALAHIKTHVMGDGVVPEVLPASPAVPPAPKPLPPPAPSPAPAYPAAGEALALSDLPSVTDLLDLDSSSGLGASGMTPLPDEDDDTGFYIEAPTLPEVPESKAIEPMHRKPEPEPKKVEPEAKPLEPTPGKVAPQEAATVALKVIAPPPPAKVETPPAPVHRITPSPHPPKPVVKADPFAALNAMKVETKRPSVGVKPKALDHKDAINTLLGELTQVGRLGAPSVLRLEVPEALDGQEIEVIVQVRHNGQTLVEGKLQRHVPAKATTAKLTLELKQG